MGEKKDIKNIIELIKKDAKKLSAKINIMEVCGTHTMAISRFGIRKLLPENIRLISGPGCPVCVTPISEVDRAIELSERDDVIITTFGDMMKVPGTKFSLNKKRAEGRDIRIVYSPIDALDIARNNKNKKVIFIGIGFETTAPLIAATVIQARKQKIKNFYVLPYFKVVIPPMIALLKDKDLNLNGFICPGHVSTIIGAKAYEPLTKQYKIPCVVVGFEPLDILTGIHMIISQIINNKPSVEIQYKRAVKYIGNLYAQKLIKKVFKKIDSNWRGIGLIPESGLTFVDAYKEFNASEKFKTDISYSKEPVGCKCGDVLKGKVIPFDCQLFDKRCTPSNPVGACMVSSEGTCAAYYKYERVGAKS
ncbi:MAG: hydrogenase formation protein HypD [Candidatus Goldbacteria bacterium]|nr:hydrogenase formation protein HypD [Candidatus Goldiibacteriota bacterium]